MEPVAYEVLLKRDGRVVTHVVGRSMRPLLLNRESIVVVEDAARVPPRRGDVILFKAGGAYVLHRVMRETPEEYLTRGDNMWVPEHVPKTALLATMTGFYRHPEGRYVSRTGIGYRLYRLALPGIRWIRRLGAWVILPLRRLRNRVSPSRKRSPK